MKSYLLGYLTSIRKTKANWSTSNQTKSCTKLTVYALLAYLLCESGKLHTIIKHIHIRKKLCTCPDQQQQRGGVKHIKLFFYRFLSFIDISKMYVLESCCEACGVLKEVDIITSLLFLGVREFTFQKTLFFIVIINN